MKNKVDKKTKGVAITLIVAASLLIVFAFCGRYFNSFVKHIANFFVGSFGMSFYGVMAAVIVFASFALVGKKVKVPAKYLVHFILLFVTVVLFVHTLTTQFLPRDNFANYAGYVYNYYSGVPTFGGIVFGSMAYALQSVLSLVGAIIVYVGLLVGTVFMIGDFFYCLSTGKLDLTTEADDVVTPQADAAPSQATQTMTAPTATYTENSDPDRAARDNAMRILFNHGEQSVNPVHVATTPATTTPPQFDTAPQSTLTDSTTTHTAGSDYDQAMRTLFPRDVADRATGGQTGSGTTGGGNGGFFAPDNLEPTQTTPATTTPTVGQGGGYFDNYGQGTPAQTTPAAPTSWQTEPTQGTNTPTQMGGYYPPVVQQTPTATSQQDAAPEESWRIRRTTTPDTTPATPAQTTQTTPVAPSRTTTATPVSPAPAQTTVQQPAYTPPTSSTGNYTPDVLDVLADAADDNSQQTTPSNTPPVATSTPRQASPNATTPATTTSTSTYTEEDVPFDTDDDQSVADEHPQGHPVSIPTHTTTGAPVGQPSPAQPSHATSSTPAQTSTANGANGAAAQADKTTEHRFAQYVKPPFDLLEAPEPIVDVEAEDRQAAAEAIIRKLAVFNIQVELVNIIVGPAFSRYMFKVLSEKTRMSDFAKYSDDIKGCLEAPENIRIIAPVLGTNLVGVEVANKKKSKVALRQIIESPDFQNAKGALCFAVGQEISGKVVWKDLAKMPHLLIAGQTGSGKSVCVNCLIISMLYKYGPEYVRFLMVDPKLVELSRYNGIPHMLTSETITIVNDALAGMDYLINEMEARYQVFRAAGVGDIGEYNKRLNTAEKPRMPYLVLIVDELADLMSQAKQAFENKIGRLAAKARAAGIHIVLATQRPDTKVITGTIKNNLTARIALTVPTAIDSGTILGSGGAEKLLGRGDMLFSDPSAQELERVQGAYVDNDEIRNVVEFTRDQNEGYFDEATSKEIFVTAAQEEAAEREAQAAAEAAANKETQVDPFCKKALRFWLEKNAGKASIASIQRSLGIGFNRAGRIMAQLQNLKYVDEPAPSESNSKPMKVLVTLDQLDELFPDLED